MYFLLVILIVGVLAIIGIFVSSHYRNRDGYKRIFTNGATTRRRRMAGETANDSSDSSFAVWSITAGANSSYPHSYDSHAPDCGHGHAGGDAGGSCSDGGGSAGADGGGH